jgi:HTH-type transcriptional regulator/antitoxin HipB
MYATVGPFSLLIPTLGGSVLFYKKQRLCQENTKDTSAGNCARYSPQGRLSGKEKKVMSDVKRYVQKRVERDAEFAQNYEAGYADFKIGVILRQARESAGLTQEELALRLQTKKSAISRIENHADDVRLSTLRRYADAVGANLQIRLAHP